MKNIVSIAIALCIAPFIASADPSITGVTGTISNGQTITITGTGFGANGPTVLLFDDFEGGTNGNQLSTSLAEVGAWTSIQSPTFTSYSNANKVSGTLAARFNINGYPTNQHPVIMAQTASAFDSFFVSYWYMLPTGNTFPGDGTGGVNWKVVWVTKDDAVDDADLTIMGQGWDWWHMFGNDPVHATYDSSTYRLANGTTSYSYSDGRWDRMAWWTKGAEGTTGETNITLTNTLGTWSAWNVTGVATLNEGDSNKRRQFYVNGYVRDTPNSYPTFDDVYIATGPYARARVEIGNANTYSGSTVLTVCTTPAGSSSGYWSDTSISCTVRQGGISNGNAWVYVTDINGVTSSGQAITFGGGTPVLQISGCSIVGGTIK